MHVDHSGLTARIREKSGGRIAMHSGDASGVIRWRDEAGLSAHREQIELLIRPDAPPHEDPADLGQREELVGGADPVPRWTAAYLQADQQAQRSAPGAGRPRAGPVTEGVGVQSVAGEIRAAAGRRT